MLIIGPLGVYYFLKDLLTKDFDDEEDESMLFPSFIGALFYLTNLSVVQHFNIPLEMFLTLFGFLGFIFLYLSRFLKDTSKINLRNLLIVSFLISPSSHTATLFYMFILIIAIYLFVNLLVSENKKQFLKNSLLGFGLIFATNLFWILPNIYFILTHGQEVSNSKIHSLFSDQAYLSNLAFGNLSDISLLKNYLFIWQIWNGQRFVNLLESWIVNLNSGISLFGYLLFFFSVLGIGLSLVRKEKKLYSFVVIFFLSSLFIASSNSIVGNIFDFLRNNVPFMKEALRFPFNKFSTIFSFINSVFLAYFVYVFFSVVKRESLKITTVIFYLFFSIIYFLPAFRGDLINPFMRIKFNTEYFQVFDYFKNQSEYGRVSDFPIHSVYGWSYYNFGYQGAGFLWFGIDRPLLNREFDRWNVKNEDYFNEMSFAVYNNDSSSFERVLNKYQIRWVLIDKNIFAPNEKKEILYFDQLDGVLKNVSDLKLDKKIGENILIYKYYPKKDFKKSEIIDEVAYLPNEHHREVLDLVYKNLGNYYTNFTNSISFGLKTNTEILNPLNVSSNTENFYFRNIQNFAKIANSVNVNFENKILKIDNFEKTSSFTVPNSTTHVLINDKILSDKKNERVQMQIGTPVNFLESITTLTKTDFDKFIDIGNCGIETFGSRYALEKNLNSYVLTSNNISSCMIMNLEEIFNTSTFNYFILSFELFNKDSNSYYCIKNSDLDACDKIKLKSENQLLLSKDSKSLVFFNEPITNLEATSIFSNFKIELLKEIKNTKLSFNEDFFESKDTITIPKIQNLSGSMDKFGFNPRKCNSRDLVSSKTGLYASSEYNLCDNININYDSSSFHILEITSRNISGLPLRVCLQNSDTLRCDLFMPLPKNSELKSDFILLPPFSGPHNLSITNQVIEGNITQNEISYLSIGKIDYLNLFSVQKEGSSRVFVYNKAFDRGFISFCGFSICPFEHVLVNNWANGWVIPNDYVISDNQILVVFWPNYLSLFGFIVFFCFLLLSLKIIKPSNKPIALTNHKN
jgi:hypothetical protein